ncbi:MAG: hypothetical protein ACFB51_13670, partial [Anaerolineae bacterium]
LGLMSGLIAAALYRRPPLPRREVITREATEAQHAVLDADTADLVRRTERARAAFQEAERTPSTLVQALDDKRHEVEMARSDLAALEWRHREHEERRARLQRDLNLMEDEIATLRRLRDHKDDET